MAAVIGIIVVAAVVCVLTVRYLCRRYRPALKDGEVDYHGVAVKMQPHPRGPTRCMCSPGPPVTRAAYMLGSPGTQASRPPRSSARTSAPSSSPTSRPHP